jgi:hypothetical protein
MLTTSNFTVLALSTLLVSSVAACGEDPAALAAAAPDADVGTATDPAAYGTRVADEQLCTFKLGVTSIGEVFVLLGAPQREARVSEDAPPTQAFYYVFTSEGGRLVDTITLGFRGGVLAAALRTHQENQAKTVSVPSCFSSPGRD